MANVQTTESEILARVISPQDGSLPSEAANAILELSFPEGDVARMNELAEKNRNGEATEFEIDEMERYSRVGNLLNLMQSKACRSLRNG